MEKRSVKHLLPLDSLCVREANGIMMAQTACSRVFLHSPFLVVFQCLSFLLRSFFVIMQKKKVLIMDLCLCYAEGGHTVRNVCKVFC